MRATTSQQTLVCLRLAIKAALSKSPEKVALIGELRVEIEIIKQFIRQENQIAIISEKDYLDFQRRLQEISKMAFGWLDFLMSGKKKEDEPRQEPQPISPS